MTAVHFAARSSLVFFVLLGAGFALASSPSADAQADLAVYEIDGRVEKTSGPLSGASVVLVRSGAAVANATTDSSGNYRFAMLKEGDYVVSAIHECCMRASVAASVGGTTVRTTAPTLLLEDKQPVQSGDAVRLGGIVRSTDGAVLAGVRIEIESYWNGEGEECSGDVCKMPGGYQYFTTESDGAGWFELDVNRGHANLWARLDGYDVTYGSLDMSHDMEKSVPMRPAARQEVVLSGVLRSADGSPLAGYVSAYVEQDQTCPPEADCVYPTSSETSADGQWTFSSDRPTYNSTQTEEDGSWRLSISPGRVRVIGSAEEHLEAVRLVEVQSGNATVDLVLEPIPPDSVTITGRVVDRETGRPIEGVQVSAENQKWGSWSSAMTDADGRFELKTKPGYTILTAQTYGIACVMAAEGASDGVAGSSMVAPCASAEPSQEYLPATAFVVPEEDASLTQDFQLLARPSASSTFEGYVLNGTSGQAIEGAVVTFYNELTRDWGSATTDADGSYRIRVHEGYYSIRVWAADHFDAVANAEIGEGETQRLDLELVPGQKRYGYWAHGGYAVMESRASDDAAGAPAAPGAQDGPPVPSGGQQVYEGAEGGLGPYKPASQAQGAAPLPAIIGVLAFGLAIIVRRRAL